MRWSRFLFCFSICSLFLVGCSQVSQLHTGHSEFILRGGAAGDKTWSETLKFQRISWYLQWNLWYDVLINDFSLDSPFAGWLSESERDKFKSCRHIKLALYYADEWSGAKVKHLREAIREVASTRVKTSSFTEALRVHPDFRAGLFRSYHVEFWCFTNNMPASLPIQLPGHAKQEFHF